MTPQSILVVVVPIEPGKIDALRTLLKTMNSRPGEADPGNSILPFGKFENLHFARFVTLDDRTAVDFEVYGIKPPVYPVSLAFVAEFDGNVDDFLAEICRQAGSGMRLIFSHCTGYDASRDLFEWLRERAHRPATYYFNWRGRTVRQLRDEHALRLALADHLQQNPQLAGKPSREIYQKLRQFVAQETAAGRLQLTPESATPIGWRLRNILNLILIPAILLILSPLLLIYSPFYLFQLRRRERRDPQVCPRPEPAHVAALAAIEDYGVTNQFSALGSLKPGSFRRWTGVFVLWIINYTARHVFVRGRLARVLTIHSASWIFIDGGKRLLFTSHYDASLDAYMDDFINKVAFGLNVTFSNGLGYPKTSWLILDGAKDEQPFKYFIRRHQLPTEVWYNAQAGLTNANLQRNGLVRKGIDAGRMTEKEASAWVSLL